VSVRPGCSLALPLFSGPARKTPTAKSSTLVYIVPDATSALDPGIRTYRSRAVLVLRNFALLSMKSCAVFSPLHQICLKPNSELLGKGRCFFAKYQSLSQGAVQSYYLSVVLYRTTHQCSCTFLSSYISSSTVFGSQTKQMDGYSGRVQVCYSNIGMPRASDLHCMCVHAAQGLLHS
jgi:hypothetical protein